MQIQIRETPASRKIRSDSWMHDVIALLDAAIGHLHQEQAAHGAILEATSLLRRQLDPQPVVGAAGDGKERLLAWQIRKVLEYIDRHIVSRVLVKDLCALVRRSEAHFSRSFRATFGYSPHAFVVRRRVEFAAQYMLQTDMSLSDIALGCGFVDQAHLCKHFRVVTGQTPAAWRRAKKAQGADMERIDEHRKALTLLAADILPLQGAVHAREQFVRSERFYEIANHVGFDCLCLRPFVRIGGHENRGDPTIRGEQMPMQLESGHLRHAHVRDQAGDLAQSPGLQQACGARKHGRRKAGGLEQILGCVPDRLVIVNDCNQRPLRHPDLPMGS